MATNFDTIYDRALVTIKDYQLDALAQADYEAFLLHLQGILERAVPDFTLCNSDLSYDTENTPPSFVSALNNKEVNILAELMVYNWFEGKINDVTQFQGHLNNKEFKSHSEGANLKEKSERLDRLREKIDQDIVDYQLMDLSVLPFFGD
jgi:predicted SAM-dependent methyltransferase